MGVLIDVDEPDFDRQPELDFSGPKILSSCSIGNPVPAYCGNLTLDTYH